MPFLGQDWRSPGDQWVRTTEGWHRMQLWRLRVLENLNENVLARILRANQNHEFYPMVNQSQPHVFVCKSTRENCSHLSFCEAFSKLDMPGAVKDLRRHNYVFKLLKEILEHKLADLSGSAQKVVFGLLEDVVNQAAKTHHNLSGVRQLIAEAATTIQSNVYSHQGSRSLWNHHQDTVNRLIHTVNHLEVTERPDDGGLTLVDLPDDCLREILIRLKDHKDIVNTGMTSSRTLTLAAEMGLWKDLCLFHFDDKQLRSIVRNGETLESLGWKCLHARLVKRYGLRDIYADMLELCTHCHALFWKNHGHPCLVQTIPPSSQPVSPQMLLELFHG